jgi:hypothetical protein
MSEPSPTGPLPPFAWLTLLRLALGADVTWEERQSAKAGIPLEYLTSNEAPPRTGTAVMTGRCI